MPSPNVAELPTDLAALSPQALRPHIRAGRVHWQTGGLAPGYLQGNLAILPAAVALDFARFCQPRRKVVGVDQSVRGDTEIIGQMEVPIGESGRDDQDPEEICPCRRF